MSKLSSVLLVAAAAAALQACATHEDTAFYGMEIAPGIYVAHDDAAPCANLDLAELEGVIGEGRSFAAVETFIGASGTTFRGPGAGTIHLYKIHDTGMAQDRYVTLYVEGDTIVDYRFG